MTAWYRETPLTTSSAHVLMMYIFRHHQWQYPLRLLWSESALKSRAVTHRHRQTPKLRTHAETRRYVCLCKFAGAGKHELEYAECTHQFPCASQRSCHVNAVAVRPEMFHTALYVQLPPAHMWRWKILCKPFCFFLCNYFIPQRIWELWKYIVRVYSAG